jgi:hypothetical protein
LSASTPAKWNRCRARTRFRRSAGQLLRRLNDDVEAVRAEVEPLRDRQEELDQLPTLSDLGDLQRRKFHETLLEATSFEDLPGKWQAAILEAEQARPELRIV